MMNNVTMTLTHETFMYEALKEAKNALGKREVPVGAVVVCKNKIIGRGFNQTETLHDATAHAEMIAITSAMSFLGSKYLTDCILYVTLEPCVMCAGAIRWAQINTLVFGATDDKMGYRLFSKKILHPKTKIINGVKEGDCSTLLKDFFSKKRQRG